MREAHFSFFTNPWNVRLLRNLDTVGTKIGFAEGIGSGNQMLIDWTRRNGNTIVHELGHLQGLIHRGHKARHIMHDTALPTANQNELKSSDVDPYDQ